MARCSTFQRQETRGEVRILVTELKLCSTTKNLQRGKELHGVAIECHKDSCIYVASALVNMYAKCGSMGAAHSAFDRVKKPDVACWNALILGYADNGEGTIALDLFARMKSQGYAPDSFTFVAALEACTSLVDHSRAECLQRGKLLHSEIGSRSNIYVQNTLMNMYAKCGSMKDARQIFNTIKRPTVVSWTSLILGYAENGEGAIALDLFSRMRFQRCKPDSKTFVAALKACAALALEQDDTRRAECLERGKHIYSECGRCSNIYVQNTLIDLCTKCESMVEAHQAFEFIERPDVVSWNTLILGYAENGEGDVALNLFATMRSRGCAPNSVTYIAVLKTCGLLGALEFGSKIHAGIGREAEKNVILVTCLVDFYAKCGSMEQAQRVFDSQPETRVLKTWTALISGYSSLGDLKAVFHLFERMQDAGFHPDGVTFLCILTGCSQARLAEKAAEQFEAMSAKHGLVPAVEHYSCMVDILGRSNKLDDAMALLRSMTCRADAVAWMTVLGACHRWRNAALGRLALEALVSLDGTNAANYVLMAQIYNMGMLKKKLIKPGRRESSCWTNEMGEVHVFQARGLRFKV